MWGKDILYRWIRSKDLEALVEQPGIIVLENLEDARKLQLDPQLHEYLIVHSPQIIASHRDRLKPINQTIQGIRVGKKTVQYAVSALYHYLAQVSDTTQESIESLEQCIAATSAQRAKEMDALKAAAPQLLAATGGLPDEQVVRQLFSTLLTTQFEYPEHFIREGVQNAEGSWGNKLENRIDIHLYPGQRKVQISDNGIGMDREIMDEFFFTLFSSLNEARQFAAGKFGVGAISYYGCGHEYVELDSLMRDGDGVKSTVDAAMNKTYSTHTRANPGTTVTIQLASDSPIDFNRLITILEQDCCYIETPLYLHLGKSERKLNKTLQPERSATTLPFSEGGATGYVTLTPGVGALALLDHRIRLASLPTEGYGGVVNCDGLGTTFSRDSVIDDPVLRSICALADRKRRELQRPREYHTLDDRVVRYQEFVDTHMYDREGYPNEPWIRRYFNTILAGDTYAPSSDVDLYSFMGVALLSIPFFLVSSKIAKRKPSLAGAVDYAKVNLSRAVIGGGCILEAEACISVLGLDKALGTTYLWSSTVLTMLGQIAVGGISGAMYGGLREYISRKAVQHTVAQHEGMPERPGLVRRVIEYLTTQFSLKEYSKQEITNAAIASATVLTVAVAALGCGAHELRTYLRRPPQQISGICRQAEGEPQPWLGDCVAGYMTRQDLISINTSILSGAEAKGVQFNEVINKNGEPSWRNNPKQGLSVKGWDVKIPEDVQAMIPPHATLREKVDAVHEYIERHFEYDTIPPGVAYKYDNFIDALVAERRAICGSANTYAALLLYSLGERDIALEALALHVWLNIDYDGPGPLNWQVEDFTPKRVSQEYTAMLENQRQCLVLPTIDIPPLVVQEVALSLVALATYSTLQAKRGNRKRAVAPYKGTLTPQEHECIDDVKALLDEVPGIEVYYGNALTPKDVRFRVTSGAVILNRFRDVNPHLAAIGYAASVLKDPDLAARIAGELR